MRRLLLLLVVGVLLMTDTARAMQQSTQEGADWRSGTVVGYSAGTITVRVADGQPVQSFPFVSSYLPALGDEVELLRRGDTWLALGTVGTPSDNPVANHSFEADSDGSAPSGGWRLTSLVGGASFFEVSEMPLGQEIDGPNAVLLSYSIGSHTDVLESNPFPVRPGELWTANAMLFVDAIVGGEIGPLATLAFTWYAGSADAYSAKVGEVTFAQVRAPVGLPWLRIRPGGRSVGVTPPPGTNWARLQVTLSVGANSGLAVYMDRFVARRLPGA